MPTCPGCKTHLSHEECFVHLRYCKWVWCEDPTSESALVGRLIELVDESRAESEE